MNLEVKLINDDRSTNGERFGISKEMFDYLADVVEYYEPIAKGDVILIIAEVSKFCIHPNELAFMAMALGQHSNKQLHPLDMLLSILSKK